MKQTIFSKTVQKRTSDLKNTTQRSTLSANKEQPDDGGTADEEYSPKIATNLRPNVLLSYYKKMPQTAINSIDNQSVKNSSQIMRTNCSTRPATANIMRNSSTFRNRQFRRSSGGSTAPGVEEKTSFRISEEIRGNSMIDFVKNQNNYQKFKNSEFEKSNRSTKSKHHRYQSTESTMIDKQEFEERGKREDYLNQQERVIKDKVLELEQKIQERAFQKFEKDMKNKKEDYYKIARQINDITYKLRVQNGGTLQTHKQAKYPNELQINSITELDIKPVGLNSEKNVDYQSFQVNHRFRPQTGQKKLFKKQSDRKFSVNYNIPHNKMAFEEFNRNQSRYNSPAKTSSVPEINTAEVNNTTKQRSISVKRPSTNKQSLLIKQLKEIRQKFAMQDQQNSNIRQTISGDNNSGIDIPKNSIDVSLTSTVMKIAKKNKKFSVEDKLRMQLEQSKDDKFMRNPVLSNRMRVVNNFNVRGKEPVDMQKQGFERISGAEIQNFLDPLRLKILMMPFKDANPIGKNADYFFLKGFKYAASDEFANALHSYQKGIEIKFDHLLCRFNMGVILFKLGIFEEALYQYELLCKLGYQDRSVVQYNKAICELQIGKYNVAIETAKTCISIIKNRKIEYTSDKEMKGDMLILQGLCYLRTQNLKQAGKCFEEAKEFKIMRRSDLSILVESKKYILVIYLIESLNKKINDRIIEFFRNSSITHHSNYNSFHIGEKNLMDSKRSGSFQQIFLQGDINNSLQPDFIGKTKDRKSAFASQKSIEQFKSKDISRLKMIKQRSRHATKKGEQFYLTDLDLIKIVQENEEIQNEPSSMIKRRHSNPSPSPLNLISLRHSGDLKDIIQDRKRIPLIHLDKAGSQVSIMKKETVIEDKTKKDIDEMDYDELMEQVDLILDERMNQENQDYFYIEDDYTPMTLFRGAPDNRQSPFPKVSYEDNNNDQSHRDKQSNDSIDNQQQSINLHEKLIPGHIDKRHQDQLFYDRFMFQIKKFNDKLDRKSILIFEKHQSDDLKQKKNKLGNEVELQIKVLKEMIVQQEQKKQSMHSNRIKLDEIQKLVKEFTNVQHPQDRDVDKIDEILVKLKSFKNMNPQLRRFIIQRSRFREFDKNQVIYQQGKIGNQYYYLIRGSTTLISKKSEFGNFNLFLKSYYDGDTFGEQPILLNNDFASQDQINKLLIRDATCICNEQCIILELSNEHKQEFFSQESNKEYERNLQWMRKVPIFTYTDTFYLLQMIFNLELRTYKYGERLVKAGEIPDGMFIVTKGQCLAVKESVGIRQSDSSEYSRYQKQPKNFITGVSTHKSKSQLNSPRESGGEKPSKKNIKTKVDRFNNFDPSFSVLNQMITDPKKSFQSTRLYVDDEGKHMPNHTAFSSNIIFNRLVPGDTFGIRTLLPQEEMIKRMDPDPEDIKKSSLMSILRKRTTLKQLMNNFKKHSGPVFHQSNITLFRKLTKNMKTSALSIIADSTEVEVLLMKPHLLNVLPESDKELLYDDMAKAFDPDKPSSLTQILKQKQSEKKWESYRFRLVNDIRKTQYMERHKGQYKR